MFGLFRKKSEKERLQEKYYRLLEEAYKLSKVNPVGSDRKLEEADRVHKMLEAL